MKHGVRVERVRDHALIPSVWEVHHSGNPYGARLRFTEREWREFIERVKAGEFE